MGRFGKIAWPRPGRLLLDLTGMAAGPDAPHTNVQKARLGAETGHTRSENIGRVVPGLPQPRGRRNERLNRKSTWCERGSVKCVFGGATTKHRSARHVAGAPRADVKTTRHRAGDLVHVDAEAEHARP
jgi:hypothetical protein